MREFVTWYCSEPRLAFNRTACVDFHVTKLLEPESSSDQVCIH